MLDKGKLSHTVQHLVGHLVRGDYAAAERLTGGRRLSGGEIAQGIAQYGRRLVSPPADSAPQSVVELEEADPERWSVYVDLWTLEEGRSDLMLELTITESDRDMYDIQIDNIHVP